MKLLCHRCQLYQSRIGNTLQMQLLYYREKYVADSLLFISYYTLQATVVIMIQSDKKFILSLF